MRAPARELFRDPAFPASDSSLFSSFSTPLAQFREDITWRRPQEICATPRLFPDNPQEGQVKQGLLGDCWFLCACAALQKSRHLLDQGPWVLRAPMGRAGGRCPGGPNRWPGRKVEPEELGKQQKPTGWVWRLRTQDLLAAAQPQGAVSDQLLSVQPQGRDSPGVSSVCVGPPPLLSRGEGWTQVDPVDSAELLSQLQEGEFWVDEEEFLREFDEVTIGYPVTEAGHLQSLYSEKVLSHTQELPGAWVPGQSAGGCRNNSGFPSNPKFWLRVSEPSEVYIAVLQRPRMRTVDWAGRAQAPVGDSRVVWSPASILGKDYPAVGLHLWKVEKRRVSLPRILSTPPVAGTVCHAYDREVHLRCELTPGYYLAVPSTFLKNVPGQFLLRVFSSGRVSLSAIKTVVQSTGPGETLLAGEWETVQLQGSWKIGQTAGGSRNFASYSSNPCFPLTIPEGAGPRCVRITLHQHCLDSDCHPIGFHVFQNGCEPRGVQKGVLPVPADNGGQGTPSLLLQKPLLSCVPHCYTQEVSRVCHLSAGTYRIVPSTYLPDTEGAFTVTIATRIDRRSIHSQEMLGQLLQEVHGAREGLPGVLGHEVHCVFPAVQGSHCPHLTISPFTGLLHGSDEDLTG
ncbi:calpain-10 isoform X13 [Myotis lucifugus]|uniref:calpain-10 isoform X13 n=1 Tax=Myotis lucifugus TaxID=59463 RepID=UPI000CCC8D28|nr:calpain-10 isoform X13 [Myotis lucifugus]